MAPMPERVSLAQVYPLDFGRRTEDLPAWRAMTAGQTVIEIGCGDGRVAAACPDARTWLGIDSDEMAVREFYARMNGDGSRKAWCADATEWVRSNPGSGADLAIIPFSTLFLIPHKKQAPLLQELLRH